MSVLISGRADAVDRREALRYLGLTRANGLTTEDGLSELLDDCERQILAAQDLKAVYGVFPIGFRENGLDLGFSAVDSKALAKNLEGCDKIVLFAATAGAGIDRLILKYSKTSPARAAVFQAMGAALAESWCDEICRRLSEKFNLNKSRFSCGFGDLPLTLQRDIFAALSVTKRLGVTLSEDCFMTPTKSVTAIVGIRGDKDKL